MFRDFGSLVPRIDVACVTCASCCGSGNLQNCDDMLRRPFGVQPRCGQLDLSLSVSPEVAQEIILATVLWARQGSVFKELDRTTDRLSWSLSETLLQLRKWRHWMTYPVSAMQQDGVLPRDDEKKKKVCWQTSRQQHTLPF